MIFSTSVNTGCASVTVALFIKTSEDYFLLQNTSRSHSTIMERNICSCFVCLVFFLGFFFSCFDSALADVLPCCCKQIFHFQQWIAL